MARAPINIVVLNPAGEPVNGASVSVTKRPSGSVTLYTSETGSTTTGNPATTNSSGRISAWVERGAYTLAVSGTGFSSYSLPWNAVPGNDASVDNIWLPDAGVTTPKIADNAVTSPKIADGTIVEGDIAASLVQQFLRTGGGSGLRWTTGTVVQGYTAGSQKQSQQVAHGLGHAPGLVLVVKDIGQHGDQTTVTAGTGAYTATNFTLESWIHSSAYAFNINVAWRWFAIG